MARLLTLLLLLLPIGAAACESSGSTEQAAQRATATPTERPAASATTPRATAQEPYILYAVQEGDTFEAIVSRFRISEETLRWANPDIDENPAVAGTLLLIPGADGILHHASRGESIASIAARYGVDAQAIVDWPGNGLKAVDQPLPEDQLLLVPGGKPPADSP